MSFPLMRPPAVVVVEGANDMEFLKRISAILRRDDPTLPDLRASEQAGRLLFIPIGGGEIVAWDRRLRRLSARSFQLYDRETGAEAARRQAAAAENPAIRLTAKRSLARRAKRWLNSAAADAMTVSMIRQRDPTDEIRSWLLAIGAKTAC